MDGPVNITLPNAANYKKVNDDMTGFYSHKNSVGGDNPVPILQNDNLIQYQKVAPMQVSVQTKKKKQTSVSRLQQQSRNGT